MFNIKGKIRVIGEVQQIKETFKKREFVLDTKSGQYDQTVMLELAQDNVSQTDNFKVGDEVNVSFDIRGREWKNPKDGSIRYFNSLSAWRIEAVNPAPSEGAPPPSVDDVPPIEETDDLPF